MVKFNLKISSIIFKVWGYFCAFKGLYDLFLGEPEANLYSRVKWEFVSYEQWLRWGGFEVTYGIFCVAFGYFLYKISTLIESSDNGNADSVPPSEKMI